jgi:2-succinyl-5-enolpyruvyl-6-hydroxy-3-cyclohexene-1-carboxylate synthase
MENEAQGNAEVLRALFAELDRLQVREFCVAAGARNAHIVAALMARGEACVVRHFFDERSAGFFAVGRMMAHGRPVGVVTTSGTAAGELLPAVMEAYYHGLPLVAITADRPLHFRRSGAPQAVEQDGIFGTYAVARWEGKWISERAPGNEGPIHFNVCLDEEFGNPIPYNSPDDALPRERDRWNARPDGGVAAQKNGAVKSFWKKKGTLVALVAGLHPDRTLGPAREFLLKLGVPIVAEATSNLWGDVALEGLLVRGGEKALEQLNPQRVLRIGDVPSWRWWRDLEEREKVHVLSIGAFRGLARKTNVAHTSMDVIEAAPEIQQGARLSEQGSSISSQLDGVLELHPHSEPAWVRHVSRMIPAGATVFLGNSLPIREWNLAADTPKPGTRFFANRGANGIDGLISSGLGAGADANEAWIVVGDLSALYDMNALWILPQLPCKKWRIVVINNAGGKIFSRVKWLRDLPEDTREVVENRHALNFGHWAHMWNVEYRRFDDALMLADDHAACVVWEIVPDAAQTEAFWEAWK